MKDAPEFIDGAKVIRFTPIDRSHLPTGNCRQIVAGVHQGAAAGLAICQCGQDEGYFLFGCDENWNSVTDTWHPTVEDAMKQAEFEYAGVTETWKRRS